jgi:hypothetical protein
MNNVRQKPGRTPRLPSIESQTVAFLEWARRQPRPVATCLEWDRFSLYLRYNRQGYLPPPWEVSEILVIASVELPKNYQQRGWFWRYCQLCAALTKNGVAIESVQNPHLLAALRRHPMFIEYQAANFYLRKVAFEDWPLTLDWIDTKNNPQCAGRKRDPEIDKQS